MLFVGMNIFNSHVYYCCLMLSPTIFEIKQLKFFTSGRKIFSTITMFMLKSYVHISYEIAKITHLCYSCKGSILMTYLICPLQSQVQIPINKTVKISFVLKIYCGFMESHWSRYGLVFKVIFINKNISIIIHLVLE